MPTITDLYEIDAPPAEIIERFLLESGTTQAELARKTGIPETTISSLRTRKSPTCSLRTWQRIVRFIKAQEAAELPKAQ